MKCIRTLNLEMILTGALIFLFNSCIFIHFIAVIEWKISFSLITFKNKYYRVRTKTKGDLNLICQCSIYTFLQDQRFQSLVF